MGPDQPASEHDSLRPGGSYDAPALPPRSQDLSVRLPGSADTPADAAIHPGANQRRILVATRQSDGPAVPRLPQGGRTWMGPGAGPVQERADNEPREP